MRPRERIGQDSMARAAPAGHSAPIPMPRMVRITSRNTKLGEKPAMKLQTEYHRMEIISGVLRPIRSAIQPDATAPKRRMNSVRLTTVETMVSDASNSLAMETTSTRNTVKSNASSVQPSQAAVYAYH